jgi:predicted MPP superfamily phosphohydrolase
MSNRDSRLPRIFDLFIIGAFILVQWRITARLLRFAGRRWSGSRRTLARAAIFAFNVFLVLGYAFSFSQLLSLIDAPPTFSMYFGAGALTYLFLATAILAMQGVVGLAKKKVDPGRRRVLTAAGNVLVAAPVVALGYGTFIERSHFGVKEIDVPLPGLASGLEGLRILQLSDIHLGAFLSERELARVIDASNELRPQLAVVTGDLISSKGDPLDACIRQIARLRADAGIFGCMGNHERYAKAEDYTQQAAARAGIPFLRQASKPLRFGDAVLNLAGVDYQRWSRSLDYLPGAGSLLVPGACNVLLSHNPDVFPVAAGQGYNFVLAGHTHGGQVAVEILDQSISVVRFITPYVYGLFQSGASAAYVTRGIGTIGIPARIGAPPEISMLRLRKA